MKPYVLLFCSLFIYSAVESTSTPLAISDVDAHERVMLHDPLMQAVVTFLAETTIDDFSAPWVAPVMRYMESVEAEKDLLQEHDLAVIAQELLRRWDTLETMLFNHVHKVRPNVASITGNSNQYCVPQVLAAASSSGSTCDLSGVLTALTALQVALVSCCSTTNGNFVSTFTVINDITHTLTNCCASNT